MWAGAQPICPLGMAHVERRPIWAIFLSLPISSGMIDQALHSILNDTVFSFGSIVKTEKNTNQYIYNTFIKYKYFYIKN